MYKHCSYKKKYNWQLYKQTQTSKKLFSANPDGPLSSQVCGCNNNNTDSQEKIYWNSRNLNPYKIWPSCTCTYVQAQSKKNIDTLQIRTQSPDTTWAIYTCLYYFKTCIVKQLVQNTIAYCAFSPVHTFTWFVKHEHMYTKTCTCIPNTCTCSTGCFVVCTEYATQFAFEENLGWL